MIACESAGKACRPSNEPAEWINLAAGNIIWMPIAVFQMEETETGIQEPAPRVPTAPGLATVPPGRRGQRARLG